MPFWHNFDSRVLMIKYFANLLNLFSRHSCEKKVYINNFSMGFIPL